MGFVKEKKFKVQSIDKKVLFAPSISAWPKFKQSIPLICNNLPICKALIENQIFKINIQHRLLMPTCFQVWIGKNYVDKQNKFLRFFRVPFVDYSNIDSTNLYKKWFSPQIFKETSLSINFFKLTVIQDTTRKSLCMRLPKNPKTKATNSKNPPKKVIPKTNSFLYETMCAHLFVLIIFLHFLVSLSSYKTVTVFFSPTFLYILFTCLYFLLYCNNYYTYSVVLTVFSRFSNFSWCSENFKEN